MFNPINDESSLPVTKQYYESDSAAKKGVKEVRL
jgi:hypothetical protein